MLSDEDQRIFACPQCPKVFATRSNLKRHMENPNIHNIPYVRSRDQKRWKGHAKKLVSKEETTERMRKWRAENREKNRQNDLRCRVYRLARQKFGEHDSIEKQSFVTEEIARRLGRRMVMEQRESDWTSPNIRVMSPVQFKNEMVELPFYSAPQRKIELPLIPSPVLPQLSPTLQRRTSSSSTSSATSITSLKRSSGEDFCVLPAMHTFLSYNAEQQQQQQQRTSTKGGIKYVESDKILDEFVGVVLNYADNH